MPHQYLTSHHTHPRYLNHLSTKKQYVIWFSNLISPDQAKEKRKHINLIKEKNKKSANN
jgi:hypothetical protein